MANNQDHPRQIAERIVSLLLIAVAATAVFSLVIFAAEIVLILFLGVVFGVCLARLAGLLAAFLPVGHGASLTAVVGAMIVSIAGFFTIFGVQLNSQIMEAMEYAEEGAAQLKAWTERYPTAKSIFQATPILRELLDNVRTKHDGGQSQTISPDGGENREEPTSRQKRDSAAPEANGSEQSAMRATAMSGVRAIAGLFRSTFGFAINGLLIFFTGLFVAIDPGMYREGCVVLFPVAQRKRVREVMNLMGGTLWHWVIGRVSAMAIIGTGAGILLAVLGIPMAFTLAIVTALLGFIPNFGPLAALLLTMLFALPQGATIVALLVVGYVALQLVESYIITPMIQQKQVALPPALLIAFQAVMGVLFGLLGAAVASPLLAAVKVAVEQAYIQDVLEKKSS